MGLFNQSKEKKDVEKSSIPAPPMPKKPFLIEPPMNKKVKNKHKTKPLPKTNFGSAESKIFESAPISNTVLKPVAQIPNPTVQKIPENSAPTMFKQSKPTVPKTLPKLNVPEIQEVQIDDIPFFQETEPLNLPQIPVFQMKDNLYEKPKGPVFVRTDEYSQILTNISTIKNYVRESPETIYMLNNLKKNADLEFKKFANILEDIQRKLIFIDNVLFQTMREEP